MNSPPSKFQSSQEDQKPQKHVIFKVHTLTLNYLRHLFGSEMLHVSIKVFFFLILIPKDRKGLYVRRYKHTPKSCSKNTKKFP